METKQPPESVTDASDILAELSEQKLSAAICTPIPFPAVSTM